MRVLLIEDDRRTAEHITFHLRSNGYDVEESCTGPDGEAKARRGGHEALIVDRMLPGKDGLSVVRSLRREGLQTPILFLSTMVSITDRVQGLEGGGDDYLTKPFAAAELLARLNAITRRNTGRPFEAGRLAKDNEVPMNATLRTITAAAFVVASLSLAACSHTTKEESSTTTTTEPTTGTDTSTTSTTTTTTESMPPAATTSANPPGTL